MVRFAPWNPNMNMSEEEYKADTTAKSQAWSRGEWPSKTVQSDTFGRGDNIGQRPIRNPNKSDAEWEQFRDQYKRDADRRGFGSDIITKPTRDLSRRERNKQRRMELLGGGRRREREYPSFAPTSGRNLASREDRMRMLTGESDFGGRGSRYGGREEYDRQDREFNRQFDEAPRGPQPWDSPNKPRGWGDVMDRVKPDRDKEIYKGKPPADRNTPDYRGDGWNMGRVEPSDNRRSIGGSSPIEGVSGHDFVNDPKYQKYDDTNIRKRLAALEGRPQKGGWQEDRIAALENRPQSTGGNWDESRIKALESRGPIVNQPTVDLSGVEGRISQLEGKGSDWQENRIAALEGRKPQDLSGIQGRLSELEGKAPSWQEDRISQLEGSRTQSKSARDLLDQRLASLENYYKNDPPPPPDESTGNRYEDKQAALNKMWEQTGNVYDPEAFAIGNTWQKTKDDATPSWFSQERIDSKDYVRNRDWYGTGANALKSWADTLPGTYRKQMRDLDREYNKPSHSAIIKGREYTAYGPAAAARLKMLDERNIHEDEYLGHGTWENKFGEEITGQGHSSNEKRYFASHSGLDPESEEYAKRFRRGTTLTGEDGKKTNYYQKHQAGTLTDDEQWWLDYSGGLKPEEHGKYGWGVVGTNKSKTGQSKWDEAYYPQLN